MIRLLKPIHWVCLIEGWAAQADSWATSVEGLLQRIDPIAKGQFKSYRGLPLVRVGENEKWDQIDHWLNDKLDFLNRVSEKLGSN